MDMDVQSTSTTSEDKIKHIRTPKELNQEKYSSSFPFGNSYHSLLAYSELLDILCPDPEKRKNLSTESTCIRSLLVGSQHFSCRLLTSKPMPDSCELNDLKADELPHNMKNQKGKQVMNQIDWNTLSSNRVCQYFGIQNNTINDTSKDINYCLSNTNEHKKSKFIFDALASDSLNTTLMVSNQTIVISSTGQFYNDLESKRCMPIERDTCGFYLAPGNINKEKKEKENSEANTEKIVERALILLKWVAFFCLTIIFLVLAGLPFVRLYLFE